MPKSLWRPISWKSQPTTTRLQISETRLAVLFLSLSFLREKESERFAYYCIKQHIILVSWKYSTACFWQDLPVKVYPATFTISTSITRTRCCSWRGKFVSQCRWEFYLNFHRLCGVRHDVMSISLNARYFLKLCNQGTFETCFLNAIRLMMLNKWFFIKWGRSFFLIYLFLFFCS